MADDSAPCQYLDWDSSFFGVRIARLNSNTLDPTLADAATDWCREHSIRCLYFLCDAASSDSVRLAECNSFRLVDIRITLESTSPNPQSSCVRPSTPADIPALRDIAGSSHADSRFYHDPNFPRPLCDELYRTWIERSCQGYAHMVLIAEWDSQLAGYISCHKGENGTGQIGLVGVANGVQGKGLGRALVTGAISWFLAEQVGRITVVTQGRNIAAQRLYARCGFTPKSVQLWYHRWFS